MRHFRNKEGTQETAAFEQWSKQKPLINYIALFPSLRSLDLELRLRVISKRLGFGGFYITYLFNKIASDFDDIRLDALDGKFSRQSAFLRYANKSIVTCLIYGGLGTTAERDLDVIHNLIMFDNIDIYCFGVTKHGNPINPLYLPDIQALKKFPIPKTLLKRPTKTINYPKMAKKPTPKTKNISIEKPGWFYKNCIKKCEGYPNSDCKCSHADFNKVTTTI